MNPATDLTIISGGQTGADRAALDFALAAGLAHGGWAPRGRRAEDGPIDPRYGLRETPGWEYSQRTQWNIRDSDATVVFSLAEGVIGGTRLTIELARRLGKPWLHLPRDVGDKAAGDREAACGAALRGFLTAYRVRRLNVAGPRASQAPGIEAFVDGVLRAALSTQ
ncbi:Putative molybdenum carrier [Pirellulimonas nuda]|uniref:Molybdenum carrier n=1 Tax=Pirellulimonas nuda TaxID=2528009 RepID=A0A518DHD4_9BACT|nr:putative molybdenum carrier protein [Pirellulimonas nuda]QDU90885.1 Putative molybdenum carrier [Pirellulimonas nuda]